MKKLHDRALLGCHTGWAGGTRRMQVPPPHATPTKGEQSPAAGQLRVPTIALPRGGGAMRGIGETFATYPVTSTGSMSVPNAASPGRSGFGPQPSRSDDSGAGTGPFGLGWRLSIPLITRTTEKGLPTISTR